MASTVDSESRSTSPVGTNSVIETTCTTRAGYVATPNPHARHDAAEVEWQALVAIGEAFPLFVQYSTPYADIGQPRPLKVKGPNYRDWLAGRFYVTHGRKPEHKPLTRAIEHLAVMVWANDAANNAAVNPQVRHDRLLDVPPPDMRPAPNHQATNTTNATIKPPWEE